MLYQGKHLKPTPKKSGKPVALLVCLVLVLGLGVGGVLAYLSTRTDPVKNTFTPSKVTTTVEEELEGNVKSNVKIKNTGDTEAWIRAAVIVTWQDEAGNVYGTAPKAGEDYEISYNLDSQTNPDGQWMLGSDGFYYWMKPVKPVTDAPDDCMTGVLITTCKPVANKAPEGYSLTVEVLGSGIQSKPASVFNDKWASSGLEVNGAGTALEKGGIG